MSTFNPSGASEIAALMALWGELCHKYRQEAGPEPLVVIK